MWAGQNHSPPLSCTRQNAVSYRPAGPRPRRHPLRAIRLLAGALTSALLILGSALVSRADVTLDVSVTDRATGAPLAATKVWAAGAEATTDAAGRARLRVPAGVHVVAVEHERYATGVRTLQ